MRCLKNKLVCNFADPHAIARIACTRQLGHSVRLVLFATSNSITISSITFSHKAICKSPDNKTRNQIDHVLIKRRYTYKCSIVDVRSYRDVDFFVVITKFKIKLKNLEKIKTKRIYDKC